MGSSHIFISAIILVMVCCFRLGVAVNDDELGALMDLRASLDPESRLLASWTGSGDHCDGSYEGVGCDEKGHVANISLQGKGLSGKLSPAVAQLKHLTGLYLHYNALYGEIPTEISSLSELNDLYLNVNNLSGEIPPELGNMPNLQVVQLCYNQLTGSIPNQLGALKKLSVLALQSNLLTGAIPASLGDLGQLMRLDLSFNHLFGSIPTKLADASLLEVLDLRNNTLSGNVPLALKRLTGGFRYENNPGLCGAGFSSLQACSASDHLNQDRPEPYGVGTNGFPTRGIPETANLRLNCSGSGCSKSSKATQASVIVGVVVVVAIVSVVGVLSFAHYRHKQKLGAAFGTSDARVSLDQAKEGQRKNGSPLISLEYSSGWDPLAEGRRFGEVSQEVMQDFKFNIEEIESATRYFAEKNLLGKSSNFSAVFRGTLRDGSVVAIKSISKTSCKSEELEFLKGLNVLTSLRHENLVRLRGFCCSKGRKECFLIYDLVPNGNLLRYLDVEDGSDRVLDWSTRVAIINGIARGVEYLHAYKVNKPALVHQNISASNVLIDHRNRPLLSDSGLHKLLTKDTVYSALKASAAMGYLAPEYINTGRFTEKSDIYAFGVLLLQIISGKRQITSSIQTAAELGTFQDFIDKNLHGRFSELEAIRLGKLAVMCTHVSPEERPDMETVLKELSSCCNSCQNS